MTQVVEIVVVIDIVDVVVVIVVAPVTRPSFRVFEPISTVLEALPFATPDVPASGTRALYVKSMFVPKAGTEVVVWNATALPA